MAGRKRNPRAQQQPVYVIGEGITEQYYFDHIKRLKGYDYKVRPALFDIISMEKMEKRIEQLRAVEAKVICVFDSDTIEREPAQKRILERIIRKWGDDNEYVLLCDSLQAIEYWFTLHYEDCCPADPDASHTLRRLKRYIPAYDKSRRFLEQPGWVASMIADGKDEMARQRAERYDGGPSYSRIYKAMNRFMGI